MINNTRHDPNKLEHKQLICIDTINVRNYSNNIGQAIVVKHFVCLPTIYQLSKRKYQITNRNKKRATHKKTREEQ